MTDLIRITLLCKFDLIFFFRILDIRFTIRMDIRKFGYPNFGYPKFRIRIRIVKLAIRNFRISEIRISFGYPVLNTPN
ncbi:hypothetical protein HanRHA438_Chr04g0156921 [Helianthus annuus]|uniref:Uncharacterized protein n=1 Tax=Helianthus annuus TaxID=4232 RepID=A0A9K3J4M2_HELAN|nr:hypothetical protein HanXRQr2_Chr04g0146801 [Helianthus annuus]KAJ0586994.1 hypothetical protein HanIR_Chr04g0158101 [Helianthus annuus]KAJ0925201.1 hypothetical protein HanRHA438_Chr04g0156921 [Helianthus annuus]